MLKEYVIRVGFKVEKKNPKTHIYLNFKCENFTYYLYIIETILKIYHNEMNFINKLLNEAW